jgi:hypothetical protein
MSALTFWQRVEGENPQERKARTFRGLCYWGLIVAIATGIISLSAVVFSNNEKVQFAFGSMAGGALSALLEVLRNLRDEYDPARPLRLYALNLLAPPFIAFLVGLGWLVIFGVPENNKLPLGSSKIAITGSETGVAPVGVAIGFFWQYFLNSIVSLLSPRRS